MKLLIIFFVILFLFLFLTLFTFIYISFKYLNDSSKSKPKPITNLSLILNPYQSHNSILLLLTNKLATLKLLGESELIYSFK